MAQRGACVFIGVHWKIYLSIDIDISIWLSMRYRERLFKETPGSDFDLTSVRSTFIIQAFRGQYDDPSKIKLLLLHLYHRKYCSVTSTTWLWRSHRNRAYENGTISCFREGPPSERRQLSTTWHFRCLLSIAWPPFNVHRNSYESILSSAMPSSKRWALHIIFPGHVTCCME